LRARAVTGFDPDYPRYSVGNLLHWKVIELSNQKGLTECDFLKGDELYKSDWASTYRINSKITFADKKFTSDLFYLGLEAARKLRVSEAPTKFVSYR
jgi:CelD/BcsL family acetyltransferase involved in cellulose biosynthesis